MKFYVASNFGNQVNVRRMMDALTDLGHYITHDWTEQDKYLCPSANAIHDVMGVRDAEALVILSCPELLSDSVGTWVELGVALGCYKIVFFIGDDGDLMFLKHPFVLKFPTEELFLEMAQNFAATP